MPKYMMFLHESPEVAKDWTPEEREQAAVAFRRSLEMICPEPVRRWLAERLREIASEP